MTLHPMNLADG